MKSATATELAEIRDIGEIVANSIIDYFAYPRNIEIINNLFASGVEIIYPKKAEQGKFKDKIFVLTGTLPNLSRAEATKMIEDNGGTVSSSVSKNTSFVLAGESTGSKYEKAKLLNIPIIDEDEFLSMLK